MIDFIIWVCLLICLLVIALHAFLAAHRLHGDRVWALVLGLSVFGVLSFIVTPSA